MARFEDKKLQNADAGIIDKLVSINRVSKTVKGGRNMSFSALVVVGDKAGRIGFGKGKALEVSSAVQKATKAAKAKMVRVPLKEGRTLHHDVDAKYGAGKVVIRSASAGTGIIAGGALRAVFECLGVQDVVAKSQGSNNPHNMVRAAFLAFSKMNSPKSVALRRGKPVAEIIAGRDGKDKVTEKAE
ncbi:MAG: 30S ribosomal protein S5 [Alphaproteobacteria bacterium]|nr:30S ribosomal protein S5 [Alphaproteobacteria bacterium]MCL2757988.1 30S ribosomal protein S5 [Alphaproteobacteria bacterium]